MEGGSGPCPCLRRTGDHGTRCELYFYLACHPGPYAATRVTIYAYPGARRLSAAPALQNIDPLIHQLAPLFGIGRCARMRRAPCRPRRERAPPPRWWSGKLVTLAGPILEGRSEAVLVRVPELPGLLRLLSGICEGRGGVAPEPHLSGLAVALVPEHPGLLPAGDTPG